MIVVGTWFDAKNGNTTCTMSNSKCMHVSLPYELLQRCLSICEFVYMRIKVHFRYGIQVLGGHKTLQLANTDEWHCGKFGILCSWSKV